MDIIINNGIIQKQEIQESKKKKILKKDYKNYIKNIPGPYYDLFDYHLCIPRKYHLIENFSGPQDSKKIKLNICEDFNKSIKYCCICHCEIKPNPSFSSKRKILIFEDDFERKPEINDDLSIKLKKIKINDNQINYITQQLNNDILKIIKTLEKGIINIKIPWFNLYNKFLKIIHKENIDLIYDYYYYYIKNKNKIIKKYYQLVYKLIKIPILYPISAIETKLLWPWELTEYQKFKLDNPNYKSSCIFNNENNNYKIKENYVIIE